MMTMCSNAALVGSARISLLWTDDPAPIVYALHKIRLQRPSACRVSLHMPMKMSLCCELLESNVFRQVPTRLMPFSHS